MACLQGSPAGYRGLPSSQQWEAPQEQGGRGEGKGRTTPACQLLPALMSFLTVAVSFPTAVPAGLLLRDPVPSVSATYVFPYPSVLLAEMASTASFWVLLHHLPRDLASCL